MMVLNISNCLTSILTVMYWGEVSVCSLIMSIDNLMLFFLFIDSIIKYKSGGKRKFVYVEIPEEVEK